MGCCNEMDWTGEDMTAQHHPKCPTTTAGTTSLLNGHELTPVLGVALNGQPGYKCNLCNISPRTLEAWKMTIDCPRDALTMPASAQPAVAPSSPLIGGTPVNTVAGISGHTFAGMATECCVCGAWLDTISTRWMGPPICPNAHWLEIGVTLSATSGVYFHEYKCRLCKGHMVNKSTSAKPSTMDLALAENAKYGITGILHKCY